MFRPFRLLIAALSLCMLLACVSVSVAAQTPLVSQTISVATNTGTPFLGAGFHPGEIVSLWTTAPDATVAPLDSTTADSQGTTSVTVSFPTAGTWHVTAHGQTSGVEVTGTYAVGTTNAPPAAGNALGFPAPSATVQNGSILSGAAPTSFPQVALDAPVAFTGSGFTANEPTSFWETAPTSSVAAISGAANGGCSRLLHHKRRLHHAGALAGDRAWHYVRP